MDKIIENKETLRTIAIAAAGLGGLWFGIKFIKLLSLFYDIATKPLGQPAQARIKEKGAKETNAPPRVVIIGGGPAGIATAGALNKAGISNIVLERSHQPANSWRTHYKRLHLHTPSNFSHLPYLPYPSHFPLYISRIQFADYVAGYVNIMQVKINYNETVTSVYEDKERGGYRIESIHNSKINTYYAEAVVVCTGENIVPFVPTFTDQNLFKGDILHSSHYHTGEDFRGKKVLIVGFGNTGGEFCLDLYEHGCDVHVLARSAVNIVKRSSLVLVPSIVRYLPVSIQLILEWIVVRLDYGDMHKYGIKCPVSSGFKDLGYHRLRKLHEAPVVDIGQIDLIRKRLIQVQKFEIERFTATGVVFKNGKEETYDLVVLATGFTPNLSQLVSPSIYKNSTSEKGFPLDLESLKKKQPGLYYVGFSDESGRIMKITTDAILTAQAIQKQLK